MGLLAEIKERRLLAIMVAYLVTGIVAVEIVSQLVSVEILPEISSRIVLVIYLFGVLSSLIYAWFHGAPGRQKSTLAENTAHMVIASIGLFVISTLFQERDNVPQAGGESGADPRSIAVLFFEDSSPDNSLSEIANGITIDLITKLSSVPELDVISENGVRRYKENEVSLNEVASDLDIGTIVTGEVSENEGVLSFSIRLVDGISGVVIDRVSTEVTRGEFLNDRISVAENVTNMLRQTLGEEIRLRESRDSASNFEAWILAQRSNRYREDAEQSFENGEGMDAILELLSLADQYLVEAERLDSNWLDLQASRANVAYRKAWFLAGTGDVNAAQKEIEAGISIADEVLILEPRHAEALNQRGTLKLLAVATDIRVGSNNEVPSLSEIEGDLKAATEADANLASAYSMLSFFYSGLNDEIETALYARRALEVDAYLRDADRVIDRLIYAYYNLGELRESSEWCEEGNKRFPENPRFTECRLQLMATPIGEPDVTLANSLLEELESKTPPSLRPYKYAVGQIMVAGVHRLAGLVDEAEEIYGAIVRDDQIDPSNQLSSYEAQIRAITGDIEGSLETLRRREAIVGQIELDPNELSWYWRNLEDHPDFQNFLLPAN